MVRKLALALAVLSLCGPDAAAARCFSHGHSRLAACAPHRAHRRVIGSGRVLSPVLQPQPATQQAPLPVPDLPPRPVQPGNTPLPAYLPNNAPPVFAPQPIK